MLAVTLNYAQQKALVYGGLLLVGYVVAINVPPGNFLHKYLIAPLLRAVHGGIKKLLKYAWRSTKELAAWLGYEGRRFLLFIGGLFFLLWTFQIFGGWVSSKFAIVFLAFALTTRKRRIARNSKAMRTLDGKLDEFGKKLDEKFNNLPSPAEARDQYREWKQERSTTSTGVDPTTATATAEAMTDPDYFSRHRPAWESFREAMRKRNKGEPE